MRSCPDLDREIARLSRLQHGAWSRRQALEVGGTPTTIGTRVRRGVWVAQDTGVYAHAASVPTWHRSVMAAVLAEPWAVASHRTAAALHRLPGFRQGRPEITVRPGANARGKLAVVHRGVDVQVTGRDRIPVTTVAQTFVDLSQVAQEARVREALSSAVLADRRLLAQLRDRYCTLAPRGGRNLRALRRILWAFGDDAPVAESELEVRLHRVLDDDAIPPVHWQARFPGRQPGHDRVDGAIPSWKLVIEADGRAWHARVDDFERDRRRDAEAAAAGWATLRFTWHQLVHEPGWVRRMVIETGARRASTAA